MSLKSLLEAVSQNATIVTESESVRAAVGTQLLPGSLGVSGLPSDVVSQSIRISSSADNNIQGGSSQADRAQVNPNTLNKVPRVYGRIVSGGVITDAHKNNANSLVYCMTLSDINTDGNDYYYSSGQRPGFEFNDIYRDKDKLVFSAVSGSEHKVVTLNNIEDNSNADLTGTDAISVYAWSGNAHANAQIFPAYSASSIYRQNAYDIMPNWTSANTMEDLVFAIVEVNVLENVNANITQFGTFLFDEQSLGFVNSGLQAEHRPLDNPAYALWDYLTDSRYGGGLSNVDLDVNAIQSWADYCKETVQFVTGTYASPVGPFSRDRFQSNIYVNPHNTVMTNVNELCKAGQATFAYDGKQGKFTVFTNRAITASEKTNAFLFDDDNIVSRINVNSTDLFSLFNFAEVTFPNILENDVTDTMFVETPTADKLSNEPTSGMTISFQGANQRSQTAAIANTTLKQSRVTDVVSFTADHSTMVVDVGDFVKVTNIEKGYDEKLFRVVRTVEQNIMGALTVKFTLAEYSDVPFEDIIYLDTTDEPFATGVGTLENYNDNGSFSFVDQWTTFQPNPETSGIYQGCYIVNNPQSGNGSIVDLSTGNVTGTETITNINALTIVGGSFDPTEESWMIVRGGLDGTVDPAYNDITVTLENQGTGESIESSSAKMGASGQIYTYSLFKLNKITPGTYKVKTQYDYTGFAPKKQSLTYTSASITMGDYSITGNALVDTYGYKTAVTQNPVQVQGPTNTRGYDITNSKQHDFTGVTPGKFSIETKVTPTWGTIQTYSEIQFVPHVEILFVNSVDNETVTQLHNSGGFDYVGSDAINNSGIQNTEQTITSEFFVDPKAYGLDSTWYVSRVNVVMKGSSYGAPNDIAFTNIEYTLSQRTSYWRYLDGDDTPIVDSIRDAGYTP